MVKGISGGERKRTSIGVELITEPSILFLDEPTTGLDSFTATSVIEVLNALAASGRTVISTIHQPNSEMFEKFDQLMLLALGKVIYMNRTDKSIEYFSKLGYKCPLHSNPCDFFMEIMSIETYDVDDGDADNLVRKRSEAEENFHSKIENLSKIYENSELKCNTNDLHPEAINIADQNIKNYTANYILQFWLLTQRAVRNNLRLKLTSYVKVVSALITA